MTNLTNVDTGLQRAVGGKSGSAQAAAVTKKEGFFDLRYLAIASVLVIVFAMGARWYQGWAAWEHGMDATAPAFDTYWMTFFYAEIIIFPIVGLSMLGYIWFTRDRQLNLIQPRQELKRYMIFIGMLFVYAFQFVWAGSFFAEQDAAWHQVVVRDTPLTPSHIIEFYGMFPMFIILGFSAYLYASTRLPLMAKGTSIPLLIATIGPMMVLPNVGYNEFGHAFWLMEERFTDPLHYGFVFFGWSILGLGGILVQIMSRISVLMSGVFLTATPKTAG